MLEYITVHLPVSPLSGQNEAQRCINIKKGMKTIEDCKIQVNKTNNMCYSEQDPDLLNKINYSDYNF